MKLVDQIPGLREAIEAEQHIRDSAFLPLEEKILGFWVQPLTLRHVLTLGSIGSPFIRGGIPSPADAGAFMCIVGNWRGFKRWLMLRQLGRVNYRQIVEAIDEYVAESFQDAPPSNGVEDVSYYSFAAGLVDLFAKEYGWTEKDILDTSVKRLFQYLKAIARRNGEKVFFNPSDRVRGEWLASVNKN